jgi:homeobox protein cut-like
LDESEQALDNSKSQLKEQMNEYQKLIDANNSSLNKTKKELETVSIKLEKQKDYDEVKQQLLIIKKIELDDVNGLESLSIEQLLTQKNKKLQGQLMQVKKLVIEKDELISDLQDSLSQSQSKVDSLTSLVTSLEADVVKLNQVLDSNAVSPKMVFLLLNNRMILKPFFQAALQLLLFGIQARPILFLY